MFPSFDFSGIGKTADDLSKKFDRIIALLEKIADDGAAVRAHLENEAKNHGP